MQQKSHLNQLTFHFPTSLEQTAVLRNQFKEQRRICDGVEHPGSTDPQHPWEDSATAVYARGGYRVCGLKPVKPTAKYSPVFLQYKLLLHLSNSTDSKDILAFLHQRKDRIRDSHKQRCVNTGESRLGY